MQPVKAHFFRIRMEENMKEKLQKIKEAAISQLKRQVLWKH